MPQPRYPTRKGLWAQGTREEPRFDEVRLGTPYAEAVEHFRKATEGRTDFDPAALFVWGTMQATAVLHILKAAEEAFGKDGQEMVRKAVHRAGYEAMEGLVRGSSFPDDLDEIQRISFLVTGINTVLYASLEKPRVVSEDRCEFDILWCPHQDRYTALDCRVQRYFVEGMLQAAEDLGMGRFTAWVDKLIPKGAECCHFVVETRRDAEERNPWDTYSDDLGRKVLKKLEQNGDSPGGEPVGQKDGRSKENRPG